MNKNDRIVITGGNGFIGRNLVDCLIKDGHKNILIIDRKVKIPEVKTVQIDYADIQNIKKIIKKGDIVIHLACTTIPAISEDDIIKDIDENVIGSIKFLKICSTNKIKKFIFISSGGTVYGDYGAKIIDEKMATNPISAHGLMKLTIENYIKYFNFKYSLPYIIIRAANPYGRFELTKPQGVIDRYLNAALNNSAIEVWGDGKVTRDFIYIDDLTKLIIKVIKSENNNHIINAGTGKGLSLNQVIDKIKKITGKNIKIIYKKNREFDLSFNILNINKAKKLFNWRPKFTADQGIKIIFNKLRKNN